MKTEHVGSSGSNSVVSDEDSDLSDVDFDSDDSLQERDYVVTDGDTGNSSDSEILKFDYETSSYHLLPKYGIIFCTEFNIGFKFPRSDTCKDCDSLHIQIDGNKDNETEQAKFKLELELHQRRVSAMQNSLKVVQQAGSADVLTFNLQQALPTPNLTAGPAFYLRKLWKYNFGIHDCVNNKGYMYMWSENIAKRGSDEICSMLLKHFKNHQPTSEELFVYSDNCGGQNKNWLVMAFWLNLVRSKVYKKIEHRFTTAGHTHLPSDRDFATIEKYKKKCSKFLCLNNGAFSTTFQKNICDDKQLLKFSSVRCFRFDSEFPNTMFVKHLFNEEFRAVNKGLSNCRLFGFNPNNPKDQDILLSFLDEDELERECENVLQNLENNSDLELDSDNDNIEPANNFVKKR
ncbi:unnamed protein product [Psylliodes chrysocephalus]|uniref:DUF7869 domain-containing protein n=1 Tax=Psylliodes chrysocephalus TaxID=3402493 RepID=A0A9P0D183_9CUCU|nr:unnamed protein product [Psylliodes chrysocephala]